MWLLDRRQLSFFRIPSDGVDKPRTSRLVVKEDGKPLGPAHSLHADIAETGGGRFSHWDSWVVFSSSDNSDPRENGRNYTVAFRLLPSLSPGCSRSLMFVGLVSLRTTRDGFAAIRRFCQGPNQRSPSARSCVAIVFLVVAWGFAGFAETRTVKATSIGHVEGNAYVVFVPERSAFVARTGDSVKRRSTAALQVLEDGRALGPENTPHTIISEAGGGRYSHWHGSVVFSSSDNSDPRTNGRGYQLAFRTYPGLFFWLAAFLAIVYLLATPRAPAERLVVASAAPERIALTVLFLGALALALVYLGLRFFDGVDAPLNMQAPVFGTASAPYSDALLWIFGGMQFLLEGSDVALTPNLYRPTIGILFGSVMAVFNSAEAVPAFFFFSLLCRPCHCGSDRDWDTDRVDVRSVGHALRGTSRRSALACVGKRADARFTRSSVLTIRPFVCSSISRSASRCFCAMHRIAVARYCNGDPRRAAAGRISSDCAVLLAAWLEERRSCLPLRAWRAFSHRSFWTTFCSGTTTPITMQSWRSTASSMMRRAFGRRPAMKCIAGRALRLKEPSVTTCASWFRFRACGSCFPVSSKGYGMISCRCRIRPSRSLLSWPRWRISDRR